MILYIGNLKDMFTQYLLVLIKDSGKFQDTKSTQKFITLLCHNNQLSEL